MKTKTHQDLCWHLPLLVAVFIQLWPIVFMVSTSLKDMDQIFQATLNPLPLPPTLNNYLTVLGNFPLFTYIYNTFWQLLPLSIMTLNIKKLFLTACC